MRRVATVGSTPDWCRPDMRELGIRPLWSIKASPTMYAKWFADQLDPSRHLERYVNGAAISFELGEQDLHIPARNAVRFRNRLSELAPAEAHVRVQTYAGLDHLGVATSETALTTAAAWLTGSNP